jgi:hypothetical protein
MTQLYNLIDVWRRFHPESNLDTYRGNQKTNPKSRLDRIYISYNWLHQIHSTQICPWFADYAGLSLDILPPPKKTASSFLEIQKRQILR